MLVLSRNVGQVIVIGDNIRVEILSAERGQIRVGVTAPKEVPVHREEIFERIQQERRAG